MLIGKITLRKHWENLIERKQNTSSLSVALLGCILTMKPNPKPTYDGSADVDTNKQLIPDISR